MRHSSFARVFALPFTLSAMLSAALLLTAMPAQSAAPGDAPDAARAGELFRAGRAAAAAGDDKTACDRFAESQKLQPAPGTLLNLGACEAKQGHLLAAREHFRQAGSGFKPDDRRRAVALNTANELSDRLAVVTVRVAPTAPADTKVTLDGAALDPKVLDHGVELDPGKTRLVVAAEGREPRTYEVDVAEGEKRELSVDAGGPIAAPAVAAPAIAPAPAGMTAEDVRASNRKFERTLGFVGAGAGVAGIAVGSVFGAMALHQASVVKASCDASYACTPAGVSAASSGSTDGIVSTTAFIAGAALAAAGAYLLVTTWGPDRPAHAAPIGDSLVIAPVAVRSGGGAAARWTF
jgi:hypothetical protein